MSVVLSTKPVAVVFIYSFKEGTSGFNTGAVSQVGECDYAPGTTSSEPEALVSLRVAQYILRQRRACSAIKSTEAQTQSSFASFTFPQQPSLHAQLSLGITLGPGRGHTTKILATETN